MILPKTYPITDARISGLSHLEQARRLIDGGAEIIQLREKYASPREFYESAKEVVEFAAGSGVRIIINDRVDIALAAEADGVHLGQDDLPPSAARGILGPGAIIGYSTHTLEQALAAIELPIDYIAFGPIFITSTKANPDETVGLAGLKRVRSLIGEFPLVAIGGIDPANFQSVLNAGANSAAVISSILSDPASISERLRKLITAQC